jgi:hypothetical protein
MKRTKMGVVQVIPPMWGVQGVLARNEWPNIPLITGVVEVPVMRADGSVLRQPGYDSTTGLFFEPPPGFTVELPDHPSRDDAIAAARMLLEVVADFPFRSEIDRNAWLAALLTTFCRFALTGPAPLFLIDGNTRGCGKSLLADVTALIASGRNMTRMAPPETDEEMRKRITALALAGDPLVLIDNVARDFGWPSLDGALTGDTWNDRVLGQSRTTGSLRLGMTWFATGNNVVLAADVVRRILHIRLETTVERPEERQDFRVRDLREHVRENRARLAGAALTTIRAYHVAGRPSQGLSAWGSFEEWSATVRGAIAWLGLGDPAAGRSEYVSEADEEHALLEAVLGGIELVDSTKQGVTVAQVMKRVRDDPVDNEVPALQGLRWALNEIGGEPPSARRIGKRFAKLQRRVVGGRFLVRTDDSGLGVARWKVVKPA